MNEMNEAVVEWNDLQLRGLSEEVRARAPWFHNMQVGRVSTAPDHFLGDFPQVKWNHIKAAVPNSLAGKSVLDIGCNAGFYAQEMARRGAARVVGIDTDERYLEQARFAAGVNGCKIEFRRLSVYQLNELDEQFDLVLFLGVFYHLRYPLFALDKVVDKVGGQLLFQSLLRPKPREIESYPPARECEFREETVFRDTDFPRMHFIEHSFAGDPTNWWLPNAACVEAMLRSAGLKITGRPEDETWLCEPASPQVGRTIQQRELIGQPF